MLTEATPTQRRAFELNQPIPLALKSPKHSTPKTTNPLLSRGFALLQQP